MNLAELAGYKHLTYGNFELPDRITVLPPSEVRNVMCASHCGLILSGEEGANNASTEYLLCGIPVVSTPSKGGRDILFDDRHVRIVQPDQNDIAQAVKHFSEIGIDPHEIRNSVITKMKAHRQTFIAWLSMISGTDLLSSANQNYWLPQFTNKLRTTVDLTPFPHLADPTITTSRKWILQSRKFFKALRS